MDYIRHDEFTPISDLSLLDYLLGYKASNGEPLRITRADLLGHLLNDSVFTNVIKDLAVTTAKLADSSVNSQKLALNAVTVGHLPDNIPLSKIQSFGVEFDTVVKTVAELKALSTNMGARNVLVYPGEYILNEELVLPSNIKLVKGRGAKIVCNSVTFQSKLLNAASTIFDTINFELNPIMDLSNMTIFKVLGLYNVQFQINGTVSPPIDNKTYKLIKANWAIRVSINISTNADVGWIGDLEFGYDIKINNPVISILSIKDGGIYDSKNLFNINARRSYLYKRQNIHNVECFRMEDCYYVNNVVVEWQMRGCHYVNNFELKHTVYTNMLIKNCYNLSNGKCSYTSVEECEDIFNVTLKERGYRFFKCSRLYNCIVYNYINSFDDSWRGFKDCKNLTQCVGSFAFCKFLNGCVIWAGFNTLDINEDNTVSYNLHSVKNCRFITTKTSPRIGRNLTGLLGNTIEFYGSSAGDLKSVTLYFVDCYISGSDEAGGKLPDSVAISSGWTGNFKSILGWNTAIGIYLLSDLEYERDIYSSGS